ncbi:MAG TPA: hypothetical protein VFJ57_11125 [Solirubrobacterales bacterium]|nr:hypothetical protein [Solirubrobacterales bacterium]
MSRGKTAFGIAVLLAMVVSAFAVASASAKGTTAYTCVKDPEGDLLGAHCLTSGGGSEKYKHVAIKQDETTTTTATNANTAEETKAARKAILKGTLSGVTTQIECSEIHGEGSLENKVSGEEMYLTSGGRLHFTGCVVGIPAGKGCKISGETITTNEMESTSLGLEHSVKVGGMGGGAIAEIKIEGCTVSALNNTFPLTGSLIAIGPGATLTATHSEVTAQGTLKFGGLKAGADIAVTVKAHGKEGEETKPISVTTAP